MTIAAKVAHVVAAGQVRKHHCHWPGCTEQVPPAKWGCRPHWYALPEDIRRRIWATYRVDQESDGRPSEAYVEVAREAQAWIAARQPPTQGRLL